MYIVICLIVAVITGILIDTEFSEGNIVTKAVEIFNNGSKTIVESYTFEYKHPIIKTFPTILYSFSISVVIALVILLVIQKDEEEQRKIRDEMRKDEIFKNVFKGVFNRLIPDEIFEVIKSDILEANIVRKNLKWVFDFEIENNQIILYRTVMYEAHNITTKDCKEIFSYIFSSTEYTSTEIEFLKWHEFNDIDNTKIIYDKNNELEHNHLGLASNTQIKKDIEIPHNKIICINFRSKEIFKNNANFLHETHFSSACSIGWELQVNYPKEYNFSILPVFSGKINTLIDDENRKEYKYSGAILKGQGIEFTLFKLTKY
jgi:hypothetical protein